MRRTIFNPSAIFEEGAPLLASVSLTGIGLPFCLPRLSRVTQLSLSDTIGKHWISYSWFAEIVGEIECLMVLKIRGDIFADDSALTIELPRLHTLDLTSVVELGGLLTTIYIPALEHLILRKIGGGVIQGLARRTPSLSDGRIESFKSLRTLTIESPRAYSLAMWSSLGHLFPNITHLTALLCHYAYPYLYETIAHARDHGLEMDNQAVPWPRLKSVTLNENALAPFDTFKMPSLSRIGQKLFIRPTHGNQIDPGALDHFRGVAQVDICREIQL